MSKTKDTLSKLETHSDSILARLVASPWTFVIVAGALVAALIACVVLH